MLKETDKIKKKLLNYIGFAYLLLGIITIFLLYRNITGFAVYNTSNSGWNSFTAVIFLVIGLIVLFANTKEKESTLEAKLKIDFYDSKKGFNEDDSFCMTDPELYFGRAGKVSLGEFKKQIAHLRQEKHGEELVDIAKQAYEPKIKEIAQSKNPEKARVALAFLRVFEPNYQPPRLQIQQPIQDYKLSKTEREEIKAAFRIWEGYPNSAQREIIKKYNLEYMYDTPHSKIAYKGTGHLITASNNQNDIREGLNMTTNLYKLIERGRQETARQRAVRAN